MNHGGVKLICERRDPFRVLPWSRQGGKHESGWTESIAVGSKAFVENTKAELGIKGIGREVMGADGGYELGERDVSNNTNFPGENSGLRPEDDYFGNIAV
jgi:hypothetical protein